MESKENAASLDYHEEEITIYPERCGSGSDQKGAERETQGGDDGGRAMSKALTKKAWLLGGEFGQDGIEYCWRARMIDPNASRCVHERDNEMSYNRSNVCFVLSDSVSVTVITVE